MKEERRKPVSTTKGIIVYKGNKKNDWKLDLPIDWKQYGKITTDRLCKFFKELDRTNNMTQSVEIVFHERVTD